MPQSIDPNYRADPITALSHAVANAAAEREEYRAVIADWLQLMELWDIGNTENDMAYRELHNRTIRHTMKLLGK